MARAPEAPLLAAAFKAGGRDGMRDLKPAVERFCTDVGVSAEALIRTAGDADGVAAILADASSGSPAVDAALPILLCPAVMLIVQGWTEPGAAQLSRAISDFADACQVQGARHEPGMLGLLG